MAIVKMKKFSLCFLREDKDRFLSELQSFGGLEFSSFDKYIEKNDKESVNILEKLKHLELDNQDVLNEQNLNKLKYCLNILKPYVPKQSMMKVLTDDKIEIEYSKLEEYIDRSDWEEIYTEIRSISSNLAELDSEYLRCSSEIDINGKWMDLPGNIEDYTNLRYCTVFFGTIPKQFETEILTKFEQDFKYASLSVINSTQQDSYILVIIYNDYVDEVIGFLKYNGFNLNNFSFNGNVEDYLSDMENRKQNILLEKNKLLEKIRSYAKKYTDLQFAYEYYNSNVQKINVIQKLVRSQSVIISEGYIESNNVDNFKDILSRIKNINYYLEINDIEEDDLMDVPIKLSNGYIAAPFEGVLEMYSYPIYREIDPTPVISIFFIVFFGMMLADAGYGIVITLASIFLYVKSKTPEKKNNYRLFIFTGISTTIWGILYGAYFGDFLQRYFGINLPIILDVNTDIMTIFMISIAFGFVHLVLGLVMKSIVYFKNGKKIDIIYDVVSWLMILFGILFMALQQVLVFVPQAVAIGMVILGIIILFLTQGRDSETLSGKIGGGIYGVYGITSYVGDIISYSRLLALGLASGFIANAFNIMAGLIPFPFSIFITPLMLIPLHLFNLGINALGTYVHSARLQYLEFFGKFYSGGGKRFIPFSYTNEYIRIKK